MKSEEIINKINEITGLDLDVKEGCSANFIYEERNVLLHFEEELGICIIYVELTTLSPAAVSAVVPYLLEANFLFSNTNGGAFSYHKDTRMVSLNFMSPCSEQNDAEEFIDNLNRHLSVADEWTKKVNNMNDDALQYSKNRPQNITKGVEGNQSQPMGINNVMFL